VSNLIKTFILSSTLYTLKGAANGMEIYMNFLIAWHICFA